LPSPGDSDGSNAAGCPDVLESFTFLVIFNEEPRSEFEASLLLGIFVGIGNLFVARV
jgi:hypothetical protein